MKDNENTPQTAKEPGTSRLNLAQMLKHLKSVANEKILVLLVLSCGLIYLILNEVPNHPWDAVQREVRNLNLNPLNRPGDFPHSMIVSIESIPGKSKAETWEVYPTCNLSAEEINGLVDVSSPMTLETHIYPTMSEKASWLVLSVLQRVGLNLGDSKPDLPTIKMAPAYMRTLSSEKLGVLNNKYLTGSCEQAVISNIKAGATVCPLLKTFVADIATLHSDKNIADTRHLKLSGKNLLLGIETKYSSCYQLDAHDLPVLASL